MNVGHTTSLLFGGEGVSQVLPVELTRYFADSWVNVESFTGPGSELAVRVEKEIGPETGIIKFGQVSFMLLPSTMPGEAIRARPVSEAGSDFWARCLPVRDCFDLDDVLFEIESQDGPIYFVVAKSIEYEIRAEPPHALEPAAGPVSNGESSRLAQ